MPSNLSPLLKTFLLTLSLTLLNPTLALPNPQQADAAAPAAAAATLPSPDDDSQNNSPYNQGSTDGPDLQGSSYFSGGGQCTGTGNYPNGLYGTTDGSGCSAYIQCVPSGDGQSFAMQDATCPDGQQFNINTMACGVPENTTCDPWCKAGTNWNNGTMKCE